MNWVLIIFTGLILGKWLMQHWLERANQRFVLAHADAIPAPFRGFVDMASYANSVQYTLAKSRLSQVELFVDLPVLLLVLWSGVLPWSFREFTGWLGVSMWVASAYLFVIGLVISLPDLPFDWYSQFHLEQRFGFNHTTPKLWWLDRLKGLLLGVALGYPLLVLMLKLVEWTGAWWWLWAWGCLIGFQLLMMVVAPVLILPLFNRFTPLPEGSLRDRLLALARRTDFSARSIQVMDGSKRSGHSNAFFTGFGRLRKIVLFDTLIQQLSEPEVEAVVAHEIGHYKKKHLSKVVLWAAASAFAGLYIISWLAQRSWFYEAFGFQQSGMIPVFLMFGLLSGTLTFWFSPLTNLWSRRHEFQADAFAAEIMGKPQDLIGALRILNEKNLGNLTPHPVYSAFFYSHPTLLEREQALRAVLKV